MRSKTIEAGILAVLTTGPQPLATASARLPRVFRARTDVALLRMLGDGRVQSHGCTHAAHEHDPSCVFELAA